MNWYDYKGSENLELTTVKIENESGKGTIYGKNWKMNEDTWGDLDTWERRDHELIRGYLNDSSIRFG